MLWLIYGGGWGFFAPTPPPPLHELRGLGVLFLDSQKNGLKTSMSLYILWLPLLFNVFVVQVMPF